MVLQGAVEGSRVMAAQRRETREQYEAWLALETALAPALARPPAPRSAHPSDAVLLPAIHRCLRV